MKQFNNILRVALKSILKNRMRSLLTSLGIIIGVCAVIVMVAIGEGSQAQIENQLSGLGTNMVILFPSFSRYGGASRGAGSSNRFTMEDVEKLKENATLLSGISPVVNANGQVIGGGNNWNTSITGVSPEYLTIRNYQLESGSFFSEQDETARRKVAVLGKTVTEELFPDSDPIGQQIRIRNTPFTVIGTLKSKGQNMMGRDQDDAVLAPSTTVLYRLKGGERIDMIFMSCADESRMDEAQEEVRAIIRQSHDLKTDEDDDFNVRNQAELIETATSLTRILTMLLGSIAGVSLIVGGIGIMNIMLVSVTERTREIGIRLSVGARSGDILTQFLVEAIVLSCTGGVLGVILAFIIEAIVGKATSVPMLIKPEIVLLSFGFSAMIGIFFGFYPARRAAKLNPIDALRHE